MQPAIMNADIVAILRAAGAVILGKTHTTEYAYFDGPPPTRNPQPPNLTRETTDIPTLLSADIFALRL
jgi:Asp-tRNA(Asn)/Glu-tRNA(Gln) amidotransferase A subunit family amidase